jgi:hypothetical protein
MDNNVGMAPAAGASQWARTWMALLARRFRQGKESAGAAVLYLLLALAVLSPLASRVMPDSPAHDLANHVSGIIEARNALAEGQFPIRVAPRQNNQERYPFFQFYGNLPYTAGGLVCLTTRLNPYRTWKLLVTLSLVCGGFFTYRCARTLTRQAYPAIAAGAVFLTAPYLLTDIHGRFAFPEIVSFALLPVVFFCTMRSFVSRRRRYVVAGAVLWLFLALAHNVTFLYASLFFGLYCLSYFSLRPRFFWRLTRTGVGYFLGVCLAAWYLVPQFYLVPNLIGGLLAPVGLNRWLTPVEVLLAPTVVPPVPLPTPLIFSPMHFGLQIGWPILAGVALALACLRNPATRPGRGRGTVVRLLLFFFVVTFMVWSPVDFWPYVPRAFQFVQFSYRLLMFVVLWGALLTACSLGLLFKHRMRFEHLVGAVLVLGLFMSNHLQPHQAVKQNSVEKELANPNTGRGGANFVYLLSPNLLTRTGLLRHDVNYAEWPYGIIDGAQRLLYPGTGLFPAPRPGDSLHLEGIVPPEHKHPVRFTIALDETEVLKTSLPPGPFELKVPITTYFPTAEARITLRTDCYLDPVKMVPVPPGPGALGLQVSRIRLEAGSPYPEEKPLLRVEQPRAAAPDGHPPVHVVDTKIPCLAQLPVLFYPGMLQVTDNGRALPYKNLGAYLALELGPGRHVISVRFVGVRWANWLSLLTALGLVAAVPVLAWRALRASRPVPSAPSKLLLPRAA